MHSLDFNSESEDSESYVPKTVNCYELEGKRHLGIRHVHVSPSWSQKIWYQIIDSIDVERLIGLEQISIHRSLPRQRRFFLHGLSLECFENSFLNILFPTDTIIHIIWKLI